MADTKRKHNWAYYEKIRYVNACNTNYFDNKIRKYEFVVTENICDESTRLHDQRISEEEDEFKDSMTGAESNVKKMSKLITYSGVQFHYKTVK